jgi:hypothetical protein
MAGGKYWPTPQDHTCRYLVRQRIDGKPETVHCAWCYRKREA